MKRLPFLLGLATSLILTSAHAADSRQDFLKLIDRPKVPLDPKVEELSQTNNLALFHFSFAADASATRCRDFLVRASDSHGRRPVVIALHGTGGSKTDMLALCRQLAARGFIAVAIDGRYHGERASSKSDYQDAMVRAGRGSGEHPFFYDTVWDVMRLVDYLQTRDDVDANRIGLIGISKGGIETYLTAAVDTRISAAVPCIGVESFRWALDNNDWQGLHWNNSSNAFNTIAKESGVTNTALVQKFYDRVAPGIYGEFDGPAMVPLIAPRPLFIINSDTDTHTPLPGVNLCVDTTRRAYHDAGAGDHLTVLIQEHTGHKVNPESEKEAIEWFMKSLKP